MTEDAREWVWGGYARDVFVPVTPEERAMYDQMYGPRVVAEEQMLIDTEYGPKIVEPGQIVTGLFDPPTAPDHSRPARTPRQRQAADAVCKEAGDDPAHRKRSAPFPGPRCATCHRVRRVQTSARAKDRHVENTFGMSPETYAALYRLQGGRCYVCQRATGKRKRLAVDHDHVLALAHGHAVDQGCPKCWRGLACGFCNQYVLGRIGGNPNTYDRIAAELRDPPAQRLLRGTQ